MRHYPLNLLYLLMALLNATAWASPEMDTTNQVILLGLDKMTGRTHEMHVEIGQPHTFGTLTIVPKKCYLSKPEDPPESIAYLDIYETPQKRHHESRAKGQAAATPDAPQQAPSLSMAAHSPTTNALLDRSRPDITANPAGMPPEADNSEGVAFEGVTSEGDDSEGVTSEGLTPEGLAPTTNQAVPPFTPASPTAGRAVGATEDVTSGELTSEDHATTKGVSYFSPASPTAGRAVGASEGVTSGDLTSEDHAPTTNQAVPPFNPAPEMNRRFSNWMFASSPAVSPFDHPVYDVWVKKCTNAPPEKN